LLTPEQNDDSFSYINNRHFKLFEPDGLTTIRDIQRKGHSDEIHLSG